MSQQPTDDYPDWALLSAWVAVVESESVSQAAARLGLSQAGVSTRIKLLETRLGSALLDRTTRPAQVTAAGRRLYESSVQLLRDAGEMLEAVRHVSRAKRSILRIGCVDSLAAAAGPLLFRGLSSSARQVRLWSGLTPLLMEQLLNRQLDLVITTADPTEQPGLVHRPLFREPYLLALPAGFEGQTSTSLGDLARELPFLRYSARSLIGQQVDRYLDQHGDAPERSCEFDATDPMLSLVAAGLGFAITTPMCVWQSRHFIPQLRLVSLRGLQREGRPYAPLTRSFLLTYREGEAGAMAVEVERLLRVALRAHLGPEMERTLGTGNAPWVDED